MKILKMDDSVFKFRRQIIGFLYEARAIAQKASGRDLQRIKVRVVDFEGEKSKALPGNIVIGRCFLEKDYIVISHKIADKGEDYLRQVVWHELAHAWFNAPHVAGCALMAPEVNVNSTKADLEKALRKLAKPKTKRVKRVQKEVTAFAA